MFFKKATRIKQLEAKIDCYVAREVKDRKKILEKDEKITQLITEKDEQNKKLVVQDQIIKIQHKNIQSQKKEIMELKFKLGMHRNKVEKRTLELIRLDNGMTKTQVANKMGSNSIFYLSQVEKGKVNPSLEYIKKLAKVYKTTPARIVESLTRDDVSEVKNDRRNRK